MNTTLPIAISICKDGLPDPWSSLGRGAENDPWDLDDFLDPSAPSSLSLGEIPISDGIANFMGGSDDFILVDPPRVTMQSVPTNIPKAVRPSNISSCSSFKMTPVMLDGLTTKQTVEIFFANPPG